MADPIWSRLSFEKCFNICATQLGNLKNLTAGFFETLITNLKIENLILKINMADSMR